MTDDGVISGAQSFTAEPAPTLAHVLVLQESINALLQRVGDLEARVAILEQSK